MSLYAIHTFTALHWYFTLRGTRRLFFYALSRLAQVMIYQVVPRQCQLREARGVDRWCLVAIKLALPLRFFAWKLRALELGFSWIFWGFWGLRCRDWNVWNAAGLKVMIVGTAEFRGKRIRYDGVHGVLTMAHKTFYVVVVWEGRVSEQSSMILFCRDYCESRQLRHVLYFVAPPSRLQPGQFDLMREAELGAESQSDVLDPTKSYSWSLILQKHMRDNNVRT